MRMLLVFMQGMCGPSSVVPAPERMRHLVDMSLCGAVAQATNHPDPPVTHQSCSWGRGGDVGRQSAQCPHVSEHRKHSVQETCDMQRSPDTCTAARLHTPEYTPTVYMSPPYTACRSNTWGPSQHTVSGVSACTGGPLRQQDLLRNGSWSSSGTLIPASCGASRVTTDPEGWRTGRRGERRMGGTGEERTVRVNAERTRYWSLDIQKAQGTGGSSI